MHIALLFFDGEFAAGLGDITLGAQPDLPAHNCFLCFTLSLQKLKLNIFFALTL
jgi:hypothetical protein